MEITRAEIYAEAGILKQQEPQEQPDGTWIWPYNLTAQRLQWMPKRIKIECHHDSGHLEPMYDHLIEKESIIIDLSGQ